MDRMINKLTGHLAGASSRRGFMRALGKMAVGGAGAIAALAAGVGVASATPLCCAGGRTCSSNSCPPGYVIGKVSYCCTAHDCHTHVTVCNDCYTSFGGINLYECTFTSIGSGICAC